MQYGCRFPRVEVRIDVDATHHPVEMLLAGKIDIGIVSSEINDRRLAVTPVFEDEVVRGLRRGGIASRSKRTSRSPICATRRSSSTRRAKRAPCSRRCCCRPASSPARVDEVMLTEAIAELVKAGLGVSVSSRAGRSSRWSMPGRIVARPLTARGLRRVWSAAMPKDLASVDYVAAFVELLQAHAPSVRADRPRAVSRARN